MKNLTKGLTTSLCVFSLISVPCFGEEEKDKGFYATFGAGGVTVDDVTYSSTNYPIDNGFVLETGVGYRFNQNIRVEITYAGTSVDVKNSSLVTEAVTNSLLFNTIYDFANQSNWTPYIGAGVGTVSIDTNASTDDEDSASTWQAKLGVTYDASEKVDVFGEYAFQNYGETNISNRDFAAISTNRLVLGLRYFF